MEGLRRRVCWQSRQRALYSASVNVSGARAACSVSKSRDTAPARYLAAHAGCAVRNAFIEAGQQYTCPCATAYHVPSCSSSGVHRRSLTGISQHAISCKLTCPPLLVIAVFAQVQLAVIRALAVRAPAVTAVQLEYLLQKVLHILATVSQRNFAGRSPLQLQAMATALFEALQGVDSCKVRNNFALLYICDCRRCDGNRDNRQQSYSRQKHCSIQDIQPNCVDDACGREPCHVLARDHPPELGLLGTMMGGHIACSAHPSQGVKYSIVGIAQKLDP